MYDTHFYENLANGNIQAFDNYCLSFYSATYAAIARLSGLSDSSTISVISEDIFKYLWDNRNLFVQTKPVGALLFRTTLSSVLRHLSNNNNWDRINKLRQVINCDEPSLLLKNMDHE